MPVPIVPAPQTQIVLIMLKVKCKDNIDGSIDFSTVSFTV
jgi:hypothetical protein